MTSMVLGGISNPITVSAAEPEVAVQESLDTIDAVTSADIDAKAVVSESLDAITSAGITENKEATVLSEFEGELTNDVGAVKEFNQLQKTRLQARGVKETKLFGSDRYKTAVEVSKAGWSKADKAILINGYALPDALTSAPLAEEYNAPILLTAKDKLNEDTLNELKRLGVKHITIIGSDGTVSKAQEDYLKSQGYTTERLGGVDRIDTSVKVANKLKGVYQAKGQSGRKTLFIANGYKGLVDATSVASPAGMKDAYIVYTNGSNLNGIKDFINTSVDDVYLVGGSSTISTQVENELKTTTNKRIMRLSGTDRKETNAKVIKEFYPNADINKVYIAKDGSGSENSNDLVDALAVGSLAGKEKNPVMLASGNLSEGQKQILSSKKVNEVVQIGEGKNATAFSQAVGMLNNANTEAEDGMKLPTIPFAKEQSIARTGNGGAYGYYSATYAPGNVIQGTINAKYGNSKYGVHTYGCNTQEQYDKSVNHVKNAISSINFRLQPDWVYMMKYFETNGNLGDNYVDPVLEKNGITVDYGTWKIMNKYILIGLDKGIVSREDAEKLAMYNSIVSHVYSKTPSAVDKDGFDEYSAYQRIFEGITDCDASAQFDLLITDICGFNGTVGGGTGHQDVMIQIGNYWWVNGYQPTLNKTDNPFTKLGVVYEAPTYDLSSHWR